MDQQLDANADAQGGVQQAETDAYLTGIRASLEEFLYLKPITLSALASQTKPITIHVLWRPMEGENNGSTINTTCLFVVQQLRQQFVPGVQESAAKKLMLSQHIKDNKIVLHKKQAPMVWDIIMEEDALGIKATTNQLALLALPGVLHFFKAFTKNSPDADKWAEALTEKINHELYHWEKTHNDSQVESNAEERLQNEHNGGDFAVGSVHKPPSALTMAYRLPKDVMQSNPAFVAQLDDCKKYWVTPVEPRRRWEEAAEEKSYIENKEGNFMRYLGYCYRIKEKPPNLDLYLDWGLFMEFMGYLDERARARGQKEARPGHKNFHVCAALAAVKFLKHAKSSAREWADVELIQDYKQLLCQLETSKKVHYPPLTKSQMPKWVELPALRDAWRRLEEEVQMWESDDSDTIKHSDMLKRARIYQKYVVMTFWLGLPPVRSQILRDLVISDTPPDGSVDFPNCIYWDDQKQTYTLWTPRQKNSKRGALRQAFCIALPRSTFVPVLTTFLDKYRPLLQKQVVATQDGGGVTNGAKPGPSATPLDKHLFLDTKGNGFTKDNFAKFASTMWQVYTGKKMPAKLIRDVVVTDLGERGVAENIWESYAFMMSHSRQTQRQVYDKRNHMQRAYLALGDIADQNGFVQEVDFCTGEPTPNQVGAAVQAARDRENVGQGKKRSAPGDGTERAALVEKEVLEPTWDIKDVLERRASKKKRTGGWEVLCQWENTWEPITNLTPELKDQAMQLPITYFFPRK